MSMDLEAENRRQASFLANRLLKRDRHLKKWARRECLDAYRVYDRDIPEIPLAIDRYADYLAISFFERPYDKPEDEESIWLELMAQTAAQSLVVDPTRVFLKTRKKQRGLSQYERQTGAASEFEVSEGGLRFIVKLGDYLDTGLFLDHRITRGMVRQRSSGKSVLNLFCYTGSFSVYAAAGAARSVDSVDISSTYLEWTGRNMALNGLCDPAFRAVRDDARNYLESAARSGRKYDLIVLDPPTFSNSKRMDSDLDLGKDWASLLESCIDVLEPSGEIFLSTNFRRFRLEPGLFPDIIFKSITEASIPPDFRGTPHRCWIVTRSSRASFFTE